MTIGTMTRAAGRRSRRVPPPAGIVATAGSSAACIGAGRIARSGRPLSAAANTSSRGNVEADLPWPPKPRRRRQVRLTPASGGLLRALAELGGQAGQERALLGRDLIDAEQ